MSVKPEVDPPQVLQDKQILKTKINIETLMTPIAI